MRPTLNLIKFHACVVDADREALGYRRVAKTSIQVINEIRKYLIVGSPLVEMKNSKMIVLKILAPLFPVIFLDDDLLHEKY